MASHVYVAPTRKGKSGAPVKPKKLRIAFIHPDLGIGGAERLVVDAAIGLQNLGSEVVIFTSHHEHSKEGRSFEETKDGTLQVRVMGSMWPRRFLGGFSIVFAIIKQVHLANSLLLSIFLYNLSQLPLIGALFGLFLIQDSTPVKNSNDWSIRRAQPPFDVIIIDQLSTCIPLLRWIGGTRVVFYCHFPDLLLSPHSSSALSPAGPTGFIRIFSSLYRGPLNTLEEATTGEADKVLVNSEFTSNIFEQTFPDLQRRPRVVYPGIDVTEPKIKIEEKDRWIVKNAAPTLLSINRFEPKKDVALAVEAFSRVKKDHKNLRLVVAGGFDPRLPSNVSTLVLLQELATDLSLSFYTFAPSSFAVTKQLPLSTFEISSVAPSAQPDILFLLNITQSQKTLLLKDSKTAVLLYTPSNEHFGIVPLEGMLASLPVLATNSGGPLETVIDKGIDNSDSTGLLAIPSAALWADALKDLLAASPSRRKEMGAKGRLRVLEKFSATTMAKEIETACIDALAIKLSIYGQVGFQKLLAFIFIGTFCIGSGIVAFIAGM